LTHREWPCVGPVDRYKRSGPKALVIAVIRPHTEATAVGLALPSRPKTFLCCRARAVRRSLTMRLAGMVFASALTLVLAWPARVLVGSYVKTDPPDVIGTSLVRGAQVIALKNQQPRTWPDGNEWLMILSPPGEYRYIREQDVAASPGTNLVARPSTTGVIPAS